MTEVSDEMLMAFADGELDAESTRDIARAVDADPVLARRVEAFRASRALARDSLAADLDEPVPDHLVAAILNPANTDAGRGWNLVKLLPSAAAAVLVLGLGGYLFVTRDTRSNLLTADGAVIIALDSGLTGETSEANGETARVLGTFRTKDGVCRMYSLTESDQLSVRKTSILGLGCRKDHRWRIVVALVEGDGGYAPASGATVLDTMLDLREAQGPLEPAEEQALRQAGWE